MPTVTSLYNAGRTIGSASAGYCYAACYPPLMRFVGILILVCAAGLAQDGAALFDKHCATCHRPDSGTRAPLKEALSRMTSQAIIASLETGGMKAQGAMLTARERNAVAEFLAKPNATAEMDLRAGH